jgi:hypothetical protein
LQNCINFYSLQELLTASQVRKELGAVDNKSIQNPLNCWKSLKLAKPQSKYEIRLGLKVAKAEKIS